MKVFLVILLLHLPASHQAIEQCCGPGQSADLFPGQSQRSFGPAGDQSPPGIGLQVHSPAGQSASGIGQAGLSDDSQSPSEFVFSASQPETDMAAETNGEWFERLAIPLRQKALLEPCTIGKVRYFNFNALQRDTSMRFLTSGFFHESKVPKP